MIPLGYMSKFVKPKPDWLKTDQVKDIYSVSSCTSPDFYDYFTTFGYNGFWLFDSPLEIAKIAEENKVDLSGSTLFYYEGYELQCYEDDPTWEAYHPSANITTNVVQSEEKELVGYDIVSFSTGQYPECSYLSCNHMAEEIPVNEHCLIDKLQTAIDALNQRKFNGCEPGPCRIFAVYKTKMPNQSAHTTPASAPR